jgi:Mg-chelatase subunit ChlD
MSASGWQVGVAKLTQDGVNVTPANRAVAGQFTYTPYAGVQWGGNQPAVGGVHLFVAAWRKFNFGSPAAPAATAAPPTQFKTNTATVLVMDVSGSMAETWQGGIKIESARSAANQIVNMLDHESQIAELGGHRVGLASFYGDAMRLLDLSADYNQARAAIGNLYPLDSTNMGAGIEIGNTILAQSVPGEARIMIVLSDGMTNTGLSPDQILAGPVQAAAQAGTCIYTVGFGDQYNLDSNLLQQIASASGCGQYYYAPDVSQLEQVYIRIRHQTTGNVLAQFSGSVAQGQQVQAGQVNVPAGQGEMAVSLHWPGSRMELILQDPNGGIMPATDPNLKIVTYANLVYALVLNPVPGTWLINVFGAEISQPAEKFDVIVSARPAPQPTPAPPTPVPTSPPPPPAKPQSGGFPVVLLLFLLGGGGIFLYVYASVLKRRRVTSPAATITGTWPGRGARLVILNGPRTGQEVTLRSASISIGRGPANQVQLPDLGVSRLHAILKRGPSGWFLQDQNSKAGTYVNGQRVAAMALNNGDRIMVGSTEMLFQT